MIRVKNFIPTRGHREQRIRKELRENLICSRGPIQVEKKGTRKYAVSPSMHIDPQTEAFTLEKLDEVVNLLLGAEGQIVSGKIKKASCTNCMNCIVGLCDGGRNTPCELWCVEPNSADQKKTTPRKAKIPSYSPGRPTWTNLDQLATILEKRTKKFNDSDCLRRAYGILTNMLGEAMIDENEEVANLLGYTTEDCFSDENHEGELRSQNQ